MQFFLRLFVKLLCHTFLLDSINITLPEFLNFHLSNNCPTNPLCHHWLCCSHLTPVQYSKITSMGLVNYKCSFNLIGQNLKYWNFIGATLVPFYTGIRCRPITYIFSNYFFPYMQSAERKNFNPVRI